VTGALLLALATLAAPPAGAVHVDAKEARYALKTREVVFSGDPVTLTHQDAKLTCRRLVAKRDAGGEIVSAVCERDVTFVRAERRITCEKATFDAPAERLVCDGSPVLRDGGSEARGSRLIYDLGTDEVRLEGAKVVLPGAEVEARRRAVESERARRNKEAGR
jgi:lipopolysaccharide export system protein LptA